MGRHHGAAIQRIPTEAQLVAVADADQTRAESLARDLNIPAAYGRLEDLLAKEHPDVVHICTAPATHAALARLAIEGGAHVYVEKPFATTGADARAVLDQARRTGRLASAGHQLLFEGPTIQAEQFLPRLGRLRHVESFFPSGPAADRMAERASPPSSSSSTSSRIPSISSITS